MDEYDVDGDSDHEAEFEMEMAERDAEGDYGAQYEPSSHGDEVVQETVVSQESMHADAGIHAPRSPQGVRVEEEEDEDQIIGRRRRSGALRVQEDDDDDAAPLDSSSSNGSEQYHGHLARANPNLAAIKRQWKKNKVNSVGAPRICAAGPSSQSGVSTSSGVDDGEDGDDDESVYGGGTTNSLPADYTGFDEKLLCCMGPAQPFLLSDFRDWHSKLPSEVNAGNSVRVRPRRAMAWNVPAFYFRADANYFRHWERRQHGVNTQGVHSRMQAHAALVSLMFAGLQQGIATGQLIKRGGRGDSEGEADSSGGAPPPAKERRGPVFDYVFRPQLNTDWPMFEIAYEDLYEPEKIDVAAVRIWLFVRHHSSNQFDACFPNLTPFMFPMQVYDIEFSVSELVGRVMDTERKKGAMSLANGCEPGMRDKQLVGELTRRQQAGYGPQQIATDFERHVPSQFQSITTMAAFQTACAEYSGKSTTCDGRCMVEDLEAWCTMAGRSRISKSNKGLGGESPMAPEFLFNAKRREALEAGLIDAEGKEIKICPEQLDPDEYWEAGEGFFKLPTHLNEVNGPEREFFWGMGHSSIRSPFDMRLPHPLTGSVVPGDELLSLTITRLDGQLDFTQPIGDELEYDDLIYEGEAAGSQPMEQGRDGVDAYQDDDAVETESRTRELNRFRSYVTDVDVMQRQSAELMRMEMLPVDSMCREVGSMSNIESFEKGSSDSEFVVRVTNECDVVCKQSNRLYEGVFLTYKNERDNMLKKRDRELVRREDELEINAASMARDVTVERRHEVERHKAVYRLRINEHRMMCCRLKEQVAKYHLRMLWTAFTSSVRRRTIPAGHVAAFNGLVDGLRYHGHSASMAFHGQGMQMQDADRTVWGHLQTWLGEIFMNDCQIIGRDRRIQDELYLQSFERYTPATWMVVVCSQRGVGKSMTAMRMGRIFPKGIFVWNSQSSE